ncbi:MAG: type 4a pilus biogenesis protein PilO [Gemmatimonadetes bacterium]|jgi:type IV pilus assembly protein PilO|nr:type 4a pilus biogenesis protein PilO [Gemmatimonadota bacterium]MCC7322393.1 type 4a pilus biogenesis protein PilO [Gemmatimonadaceae bacterium]MBK6454994.1 type 4a pilus biogenesis protein PilO [Gemmatimonadota bacterium]MBK6841178.1 type 4a pilus biogenesis protein PilO [Gemmatimonadota bacterium]MBK7834866.1 type 4a pilus biogenesis protein PilO [Gemmatimonadota bacterium]
MAFPPKSQREQAMLLVSIVALALVGLYWTYVYSPKGTEIVTMTERVDTLESRNQRARAELKTGNVEALKAEAARHARDLEVMRQLVPTGNEVPALLEQVSTAARRVGLDLATVQPEPVIEGDQFDTYRYKITVTGGYHNVAEFLTNVGSLTRIIAPVNLALTPATSSVSGARSRPMGGSALDTKFEIQTYVAKTSASAKGGKS